MQDIPSGDETFLHSLTDITNFLLLGNRHEATHEGFTSLTAVHSFHTL